MAGCSMKLMSTVVLLLICGIPGIRGLEESFEDGQLKIVGKSQSPYEFFEETAYANLSTLEEIRLEKVEFRPHALVNLLKNCMRLREIYLDQVTWTGEFKDKLNLPQLFELVEIRRTNWTFAESSPLEFWNILFLANLDNATQLPATLLIRVRSDEGRFTYAWNGLDQFKIPYDIQQYFTYTWLRARETVIDLSNFSGSGVTSVSIWNSAMVNGSSVDLLCRLGSIRKLILDHLSFQDGHSTYDLRLLPVHSLVELELVGAQLVYSANVTSDLIFPSLQKLYLSDVTFDWSGIKIPRTKFLRISNTSFVGSEFEFVAQIESLEQLDLAGVTVGADQSEFDLAWLSNSTETIKRLNLTNLRLRLSLNVQLNKTTLLILENCTLDQSLMRSFSSIFGTVDTVELINQISDNLLQALFKTSINELYIKEERPLFVEESVLVKEFLRKLNMPSTSPFKVSLYTEGEAWKSSKLHKPKEEFLAAMEANDAEYYIYLSILALICGIGILGNVVSVVVLLRKAMRSSTSCFMTALALFDLRVLVAAAVSLPIYAFKLQALFLRTYFMDRYDHWSDLVAVLQGHLRATAARLGEAESSLIYPLSKTAYTASVYLTILLTLERFAAVCYPLKIKLWTSKKKAICSSTLVLLSAILVNIPRWLEAKGATMEMKLINSPEIRSTMKLTLERKYSGFNIMQVEAYRVYYHGYLWTLLMYILPLPLLCFLNARIWTQTRRSILRRRELASSATEGDLTSLTLMLLCVSVCFVLCNATNWVIVLVLVSLGHNPRDIDVFASIPIVVNSSTNFIFYCILGKKFRAELMSLLRRCFSSCHWPSHSQAAPPAAPGPRRPPSTENQNVRRPKRMLETGL